MVEPSVGKSGPLPGGGSHGLADLSCQLAAIVGVYEPAVFNRPLERKEGKVLSPARARRSGTYRKPDLTIPARAVADTLVRQALSVPWYRLLPVAVADIENFFHSRQQLGGFKGFKQCGYGLKPRVSSEFVLRE